MLTSVNRLLLLHETTDAKLQTPLLTISDFAQQIITSIELLYSFGPAHAWKIETEIILAAFNNIYITGFK